MLLLVLLFKVNSGSIKAFVDEKTRLLFVHYIVIMCLYVVLIDFVEDYVTFYIVLKHRREQKRRGGDESLGSFESRWLRTSQAAKAGNKEIRKRVPQAETYCETNHTSTGQVSDSLWPHTLRRWASRESLDH